MGCAPIKVLICCGRYEVAEEEDLLRMHLKGSKGEHDKVLSGASIVVSNMQIQKSE